MWTTGPVVAVILSTIAGGVAGAWLFATRVSLCVDGVDGNGMPAGFCADETHLSVAGAVGTALMMALIALVVVAVRGRRRTPR